MIFFQLIYYLLDFLDCIPRYSQNKKDNEEGMEHVAANAIQPILIKE